MNNKITFRQAVEKDKEEIVSLSQKWEKENITFGYMACSLNNLTDNNIWVCITDEKIVGYLYGVHSLSEGMSVIPKGITYFEIEDLYIDAEWRNKGIGEALYLYTEKQLKNVGIKYILLNSATKDYLKAINFYTTKAEFKMWTMTFYKEI